MAPTPSFPIRTAFKSPTLRRQTPQTTGTSALLCWLTLAAALLPALRASYDVFTPDDVSRVAGPLMRMVTDIQTGRVYVGAVNRLYQLSAGLQLEVQVETGPREDNPMCPPPSSECQCVGQGCREFQKGPMDSVSKVLVIDQRGERLIACSNLFQGHCDKRLLRNISHADPPVWAMLVPNDDRSSVVMFVGPGPPNPASTHILYVATTRSTRGLPAYKDIVPAICMRSLHDLDLVSDDILTPSRIEVEVQQRDLFRVDYVYGFGSLGFSYFLTVQRVAAVTDSEKYVAQIARVCQSDAVLYSYTEVPLECHRAGTHYNVLRAARVAHPGTALARALGLAHIGPRTDAEHVLVALFSARAHGKEGSRDSALCVYTLLDVRRKFTETIQRCFQGVGNTGPDHFVQPKACLRTPFEIGDDYCGQYDINHPIKGTQPVSREAVMTWRDVNVTSLAVTITSDFTVAFVGTDTGHLRKVTIASGDAASEYDSVLVEADTKINQDMDFDKAQDNIYVLTNNKIHRIPVQDCARFTSCGDCLGSRDPYCGWCALERKCCTKTECPSAEVASRWVPYHTGACPRIVNMPSRQSQKQTATQVVMTVQSLPTAPPAAAVYQCGFSGHGVTRTTDVQRFERHQELGAQQEVGGNSTLRCETPIANLLPAFPTGKDHIVMTLALMLNGQVFLSTNFTFFDCTVHNTCTKCTTSEFPCWWCVERHRCTNNREKCNNNVLITGRRVQGKTDTPGPEYCPRIGNVANSSEILIPSGTESSLRVKAIRLQSFQKEFKCIFNFKRDEEKHARLITKNHEHFIECDPVLFEYAGSTHYINVPFNIVWEGGRETRQKSLDNQHNIQVQVFKCEEMAQNCGRCRTIDARHGCGWCGASLRCSVAAQCDEGPWRSRDHSCTDPTIDTILPVKGPVEGGTRLTVKGENLGISAADTVVRVADVPCVITHYEPSVQLTCRTGRSDLTRSGPVLVLVANQFTALSSEHFQYVTPEITGLEPRVGPQSGGTVLTLTGRHLDAGTDVTLTLTNGSISTQCDLQSRAHDVAYCVTSRAVTSYVADVVEMRIDSAVIAYRSGRGRGMRGGAEGAPGGFQMVEDPVVESVAPARSIISGGTEVTVRGERLRSVARPRMIVYIGKQNVTSLCETEESAIVCAAPDLSQVRLPAPPEPSAELPLSLQYGFLLDNVIALRNLSAENPTNHRAGDSTYQRTGDSTNHMAGGVASALPRVFLYYPDPTFEEFDGGVKQFYLTKNEYLTINGRYLNLGLDESDLRVTIDDLECSVTSLSANQLTCQPLDPDLIPSTAAVIVHVGRNTTFHIGSIRVEGSSSGTAATLLYSWQFLAGVGAVGVALLLFCSVGCVVYRRKSRERDVVMRRMKNQMDVLEARVAKECKEAFAELQTDMTDVTSDIPGGGQGGIPFRDYRSFSMCVLFPAQSVGEHPIVRPLDCDVVHTESLDKGMRQFRELIHNKTFLLLFIRSLESNEKFAVRERVNVASLLSVILQNRMDYHTDILKTLLAELIERAIEGKRHPKLLLRRTESVAEKMLTNWFTFLLFKFLRESAGEPLFLLYRAIKQQVDKGPIDAVTGEARYSLSELKLIRQHVDYKNITLRVLDPEQTCSPMQLLGAQPPLPPNHAQEYPVKLLDCDTVSQVKEKLLDAVYRTAPFSSRPHKDDLDLEWRTPTGRRTLHDDDVTTKLEQGGYRRLNTLAHYRIPDNSLVALVPRQHPPAPSLGNAAYFGDKLIQFSRFGSLPTSQSVTSSNLVSDSIEHGAKQYHLVKSVETDQKQGAAERGIKMVSEVYLTRLLTTKGTLQQFVDDLFETIFSAVSRGSVLPLAIKHMFDFLDDQALSHGITDPEVVHTWKSNSLPLRFWVNVLKNPEFVFDIHKSNIVDACLSVVAQTFMGSCAMDEQKLSKDSPANKLLYAKDIPKYKKWVERYYEDIKQMPSISLQDMNSMLMEESKTHKNEFNTSAALQELYAYTFKYNDDLMQSLGEDEFARNDRLPSRLRTVHATMNTRV